MSGLQTAELEFVGCILQLLPYGIRSLKSTRQYGEVGLPMKYALNVSCLFLSPAQGEDSTIHTCHQPPGSTGQVRESLTS